MNGDLRPTDATLKALDEAVGELARRGHAALQAEHILLGLPYAPSGAAVLQAGMEEARRTGTGRLSTAALLLGVLAEGGGASSATLGDAGLDIPRLKSAVTAGAGAGDEPA